MGAPLTISASEANRSFSKLLRRAALGQTTTITSHGRPVAEVGPVKEIAADDMEQRREALAALEEHWRTLKPVQIERWTREELYDRDAR